MAQVLVVDDDDDIREIVELRVSRAGHRVLGFGDPCAVLAAVADVPLDLALLDWSMPGMNGGELCARLRELPHLASLPVVVVTAHSDLETRERARAAGATGYLTKPFTMRDLDACVHDHLAAHGVTAGSLAG